MREIWIEYGAQLMRSWATRLACFGVVGRDQIDEHFPREQNHLREKLLTFGLLLSLSVLIDEETDPDLLDAHLIDSGVRSNLYCHGEDLYFADLL